MMANIINSNNKSCSSRKTRLRGLYNYYWKFTIILMMMMVSLLGIIEKGLAAPYTIEYVDTIIYVSLDPSTYSMGCYKTKVVEVSFIHFVHNNVFVEIIRLSHILYL